MDSELEELEEIEYIYTPETLLRSCSHDNNYDDMVIQKTTNNKSKKKIAKVNFFVNTNTTVSVRKFNPRLPPYKLINK
jgi:hypothetical protein